MPRRERYDGFMIDEALDRSALAVIFKALGDPTRLRIFEFLRGCARELEIDEAGQCRPAGACSVGEVCCRLDQNMSTVSHHMKELRLAGLIRTEKRGRWIYCSINPTGLDLIREFLDRSLSGARKRVLFVCVHNAGRSQMAEAFFNRLAKERGLDAAAQSAGTAPGERINPVAVEAMAEVGISLDGHHPRLLTPEMAARSDRIITMGCGVEADMCPAGTFITEDWQLPDPHGQPLEVVRQIRDAVRERVEGLVDELAAGPKEARA